MEFRYSQEVAMLNGHTPAVWSVTFSPNGIRLVSVSRDETVRIWDAVNHLQLVELEAHDEISIYSSLRFPSMARSF
jgi:WD40 repeat protein